MFCSKMALIRYIYSLQVREQLGADHWQGRTAPLHVTAEFGRPECTEMMLKAGAKVNA